MGEGGGFGCTRTCNDSPMHEVIGMNAVFEYMVPLT